VHTVFRGCIPCEYLFIFGCVDAPKWCGDGETFSHSDDGVFWKIVGVVKGEGIGSKYGCVVCFS
jgi:hypothetical protein